MAIGEVAGFPLGVFGELPGLRSIPVPAFGWDHPLAALLSSSCPSVLLTLPTTQFTWASSCTRVGIAFPVDPPYSEGFSRLCRGVEKPTMVSEESGLPLFSVTCS